MKKGARFRKHMLIMLLAALVPASHWTSAAKIENYELNAVSISNHSDYAHSAHYDTLLAKVQQKGRMRVIVRLNTSSQSKTGLTGQEQHITKSASQDKLLKHMAREHLESVKRFQELPYVALEVSAEEMGRLRNSTDVEWIIEDRKMRPSLAESIPLIGAQQSFTAGYSGVGQSVAILDTGVDKNHPVLVGKVVAEACFSTNSQVDNANSLCPNGTANQIGTGAGNHCQVNGCSHGTHVAGIAAGSEGVARDATIISVQVFSEFQSPDQCAPQTTPCLMSFLSDQMKGLEFIRSLQTRFNIAAVNMSLGGEQFTDPCDNEPIKPLIDGLRASGIATVIASGNDGKKDSISTPACISSAISVGATTKGDVVAGFSNSANFLNLLAPGVSIVSAVPGGGTRALNGTSMAAPHVAGAWAVLKSKVPKANVESILLLLRDTGVLVTDNIAGTPKPRIKLDEAVVALAVDEDGGSSNLSELSESLTKIHSVSAN